MPTTLPDLKRTALLIGDLQNDFLDPKGAYGRAGQSAPEFSALPGQVLTVANAIKRGGGMVVASRFTLWPDATGEPMIAPHLRRLRPFLTRGDFAPDSWGQQVVEPLNDLVDVAVNKVAYSSFYSTQLDWVLRHAGIDTVVVTGIVTQGGVASTVRDAHVREFHPIVLSDGCASLSKLLHETALADLASIASVITCSEFLKDTV
ncbi:MAG: cysteine hydrolase [Burkholderiaceae bacterium]